MKEEYTHAGLAVIITLFMYSLSFSAAYDEMKTNVLGVIMMFLVMATVGNIYARMFYGEKKNEKK